MTRFKVLDFITEFQQEKCMGRIIIQSYKKKAKRTELQMAMIERVQLMKAKDIMFEKTGLETEEVDFNIVRLNLFEDEEFNAISQKLPEMMKEAVARMQDKAKKAAALRQAGVKEQGADLGWGTGISNPAPVQIPGLDNFGENQ